MMLIEITLDAETESLLRTRAKQQEQDMGIVASKLASVLKWQEQDSLEAIKGIQKGLNDFDGGRFSSFEDFVAKQHRKHDLSGIALSK